MSAFDYLLKRPEIALPLIAVLILYFGYHSNAYKPVRRTEKLNLYFSGFVFLAAYVGIQAIIVYIASRWIPITPLKVVYWLSLLFFVSVIFYGLRKLEGVKSRRLRKCVLLVILAVFFSCFFKIPQSIVWNYLSEIESSWIKWCFIFLSIYHASMVLRSAIVKGKVNHISYDYKDFYFGTTEMNVFQYPVFSYLLRLVQKIWYEILLGGDTSSNDKKEPSENSES
ncbi:MAG TPA: hypothetical protein HA232_01330 [Methanocellales archaeon]|nr:hypothetical protein [Methanocellales archaeon]